MGVKRKVMRDSKLNGSPVITAVKMSCYSQKLVLVKPSIPSTILEIFDL